MACDADVPPARAATGTDSGEPRSLREDVLLYPREGHPRTHSLALLLSITTVAIVGCEAESRRDFVADPPRTPELREWVPAPSDFPDAPPDTLLVADGIRDRLERWSPETTVHAGAHPIHSAELLFSFYSERGFDPLWLSGPRLSERGERLAGLLELASLDGLRPSDYHLPEIDSVTALLGQGGEDELRHRVDLELLLTDAFLLFGAHLGRGRLSPATRQPNWTLERDDLDMLELLRRAAGEEGIEGPLDRLRPLRAEYGRMREGLALLIDLARRGGWETVPSGERLEEGMRGPRVAALRGRLEATGELRGGDEFPEDPELFDAALTRAVRVFQMRHGLEVDGVVGPATLAAMNVPVAERIRQFEVNLERQRWLPRDLGDRYFFVNIAGFTVDLVVNGERVRHHRVIVGRDYRQTPLFSATMTYLVFAPHWHVPPGIAANDVLPRIRQSPAYLAEQRMVLFNAVTNERVDPGTVDWSGMRGAEFNRRFRVRQDPGPQNALGRVKFMFPNQHHVYLHDTPAQALFERAVRDFSSGCIRVESALDLAEYLLQEDPAWTRARMEEVIAGGRERNVTLPVPWRIHMQYWTSWVDEEGTIHFREDIYSRDGALREALDQPHPKE